MTTWQLVGKLCKLAFFSVAGICLVAVVVIVLGAVIRAM